MSNQNRRNPPAKWVIPDVINPPEHLCFQISVPNNKYHIAALRGALYNLTSARFWGDDIAHSAIQVASVWEKLFDAAKFTDCDGTIVTVPSIEEWESDMDICEALRWHNGRLQGFCCGEWSDIGSDDGSAPNGGAGQPSGGAPQPPSNGGCQQYTGDFAANSQWLLPYYVSAGDALTNNGASGAGQGSTDISWYCVDGKAFALGACVASTYTNAGNPLPSALQGKLIANVGGTWYPFAPGDVITVAGGISHQPVYIQANFPLSGASGSYHIDVTACNNAVGVFSHQFDFVTGDGGWFPDTALCGGLCATYTPGVGWQSVIPGSGSPGSCLVDKFLVVAVAMPATTITSVRVVYNLSTTSPTSGAQLDYPSNLYGTLSAALGAHDQTITNTVAGMTYLRLAISTNSGSGDWTCSKIIISGLGVDPF